MRTFHQHRVTLLVSLGYLILSLILTAPLLSSRAIVGEGYAGGLSLWVTWFPRYAFGRNLDMVYNAQSLYPINTNLLPILSLPTSFFYEVLRPFFGSLLAYNLLYPLYLALTAGMGFAFVRRHVKNPLLAAVGGGLLAFNPISFGLAERGDLPLLAFFVFPAWMLLWDGFLAQMTLRRVVWLVGASYVLILFSVQSWNLALTLLLPYAIFRAHRAGLSQAERACLLEWVGIGGLGLSFLFLLFPAPVLLRSTYTDLYKPLGIWQGALNLGGWTWEVFAWGGLAALALSLLARWEVTPDRRWWMLIVGLNLSVFAMPELAPLRLLGAIFDTPHNPALTRPALFVPPAILGGGVLILQFLDAVLRQFHSQPLRYGAIIGAALLLFEASGWWMGLPTSEVPPIDFYTSLAQEPENYVLIDFPIGVDSLARRSLIESGEERGDYAEFSFPEIAGRTLVYMPQHHKRVVGGLTASLKEEELAPYRQSPLIRLLTFQPDDPALSLDDKVRAIRREVVRWRVAYIVMRPSEVPPEFAEALRGWLNWIGSFCHVGAEGELEFWRATWHPSGCPPYMVQLGGAAGILAAGAGWYLPEYWDVGFVRVAGMEEAKTAEVKLWIDRPASDYTLTLHAQSPLDGQSVEIIANGESLGDIALAADWGDYAVRVPRRVIGEDGLLNLELRHRRVAVVDGRPLTAVYQSVTMTNGGK